MVPVALFSSIQTNTRDKAVKHWHAPPWVQGVAQTPSLWVRGATQTGSLWVRPRSDLVLIHRISDIGAAVRSQCQFGPKRVLWSMALVTFGVAIESKTIPQDMDSKRAGIISHLRQGIFHGKISVNMTDCRSSETLPATGRRSDSRRRSATGQLATERFTVPAHGPAVTHALTDGAAPPCSRRPSADTGSGGGGGGRTGWLVAKPNPILAGANGDGQEHPPPPLLGPGGR